MGIADKLKISEQQLRLERKEGDRLRALLETQGANLGASHMKVRDLETAIAAHRSPASRVLTIVESPFLGGLEWAVRYARLALADSLRRGESPFASHLLYPQVLDDMDPESRRRGLEAGLALYPQARQCVVYVDFGVTPGMAEGLARALRSRVPISYRAFGPAARHAIANNEPVAKNVVAEGFNWPLRTEMVSTCEASP